MTSLQIKRRKDNSLIFFLQYGERDLLLEEYKGELEKAKLQLATVRHTPEGKKLTQFCVSGIFHDNEKNECQAIYHFFYSSNHNGIHICFITISSSSLISKP